MSDLNNKQIVLLSMFVSFVVSIATGIITVAMLEEAPQTVTQTVNRVVERTIERVVPDETKQNKPLPITTVTKEVTVYAKEDDLIVAAVEKNQSRIAKIYDIGASTSSDPVAIGFVASRDGLIVTEADKLVAATPDSKYTVIVNGVTYSGKGMSGMKDSNIAFIKIDNLPPGAMLDAVTFNSIMGPKLAQTILILGGRTGEEVFKTTVGKLRYGKPGDAASTTPPFVVALDMSPTIPEGNHGALAVNLDGQAVGIALWSDALLRYYIYPVAQIIKEVTAESGDNKSALSAPRSIPPNMAG